MSNFEKSLEDLCYEVLEVLNDGRIAERLANEIYNQYVNDDGNTETKGRELASLYLDYPDIVNKILMTLTGWSMESIMVFAGLLPDKNGIIS